MAFGKASKFLLVVMAVLAVSQCATAGRAGDRGLLQSIASGTALANSVSISKNNVVKAVADAFTKAVKRKGDGEAVAQIQTTAVDVGAAFAKATSTAEVVVSVEGTGSASGSASANAESTATVVAEAIAVAAGKALGKNAKSKSKAKAKERAAAIASAASSAEARAQTTGGTIRAKQESIAVAVAKVVATAMAESVSFATKDAAFVGVVADTLITIETKVKAKTNSELGIEGEGSALASGTAGGSTNNTKEICKGGAVTCCETDCGCATSICRYEIADKFPVKIVSDMFLGGKLCICE